MNEYELNRRIISLENILLRLKAIQEDVKELSSSVDDTILEVRYLIDYSQIIGKESDDAK